MGNQQCCGKVECRRRDIENDSTSSIVSEFELEQEMAAANAAPVGLVLTMDDFKRFHTDSTVIKSPKEGRGSSHSDDTSSEDTLSDYQDGEPLQSMKSSKDSLSSMTSSGFSFSKTPRPRPILKRQGSERKHRRSVTFGIDTIRSIPSRHELMGFEYQEECQIEPAY
mmetsp:Transcript_26250/g.36633  ORF Transcript_26250/g.36633 Transcript_26250/m.36633 type:complete len:167 (+) Transcript_26250:130-630(+)|eukprot:CAMPEP_0185251180 /NCGR_PEP_ID=MMETSP1359-20130426/613_1 /TAXON_ID=552665 /ORGANISM="Bigelowiella longifila, Strain CCMP242" /LENGTH=166 /DNA_ID=CAMNT_0027832967 /DNA_START=570 /DNA_END=1070 /DNA_ORIENTATION=-